MKLKPPNVAVKPINEQIRSILNVGRKEAIFWKKEHDKYFNNHYTTAELESRINTLSKKLKRLEKTQNNVIKECGSLNDNINYYIEIFSDRLYNLEYMLAQSTKGKFIIFFKSYLLTNFFFLTLF